MLYVVEALFGKCLFASHQVPEIVKSLSVKNTNAAEN